MVGGTFIQLKAGRPRPESAKQSEIRLAAENVTDCPFWDRSLARRDKEIRRSIHRYFRGIWLLLSSSQFSPGNWRSIVQASVEKRLCKFICL
jgi:hypothetical protein